MQDGILRVAGHVSLRTTSRGKTWHTKLRISDPERACGYRDERRVIGPHWPGKGGPPRGTFNRRTAREVLAQRILEARNSEGARAAERQTFAVAAEALLAHLEHVERVEVKTIIDYRSILKRRLLPAFGHRPLDEIESRDVAAYRDKLLARGTLSPRSIRRDVGLVNAVCRRAVAEGRLDRNPASAEAVKRPRLAYDPTSFAVLTADEVRLAAAQMPDPAGRAMVLAGAFAGLRLGELVALRWADVDSDKLHVRRSWNGREKAPKSGKGRSVPLVLELRRALDDLRDASSNSGGDDHVFDSAGQRPSGDRFRRDFYSALTAAGLGHLREGERPLRVHDLRHTFGSIAVKTAPLSSVKAWMGHSTIAVTERYLHHVPAADDAARLGRAFGEAA